MDAIEDAANDVGRVKEGERKEKARGLSELAAMRRARLIGCWFKKGASV